MKNFLSGISLRNRILLLCMLLVFIVLLTCVLVSTYVVTREVSEVEITNAANTLRAVSDELSSAAGTLSGQIATLANSDELKTGLTDYAGSDIIEKYLRWRNMDRLLANWQSYSGYKSVKLYMSESNVLLRDGQRYIDSDDIIGSCLPYSTQFGTQYWRVNAASNTCSCFMPIVSSFSIVGYVELEMELSWYSPAGQTQESVSRVVCLADANGNILMGPGMGETMDIGSAVDCTDLSRFSAGIYQEGDLLLTVNAEHTPFIVAARLDNSLVTASSHRMIRLMMLFNIPVLFMALVLAWLLSKGMSGKLRRLSHEINRIKQGDFRVLDEKPSKDELDQLLYEFSQMSEQLMAYMAEIRKTERIRKESELQILQHQINPHFIANVLATVDAVSRQNNPDQVHMMLRSVCDYLRLSFSKSWQISKVEKELELVRTYWRIEQYCFDMELKLRISAGPDVLTMYIPPLIIQTLVENSILHGMKHGDNACHAVDIRITRSENVLMIEVEDNGQGMTAQRLEDVRRAICSNEVSDCYGLWNVNRRVSERYGKEYGLIVESRYNVGTLCVLTLPVIRTENDDAWT